jgi:hypothetical protein
MSDKASFIRDIVIRRNCTIDTVDAAIEDALKVWDRLTERGFGDKKSLSVAIKSNSAYDVLTEEQRVWFDRFWQAFNYKKDRENAAKTWLQLGVLPNTTYQKIIEAAQKTASEPLPRGQSRKMAQGWLNDKRWEDEHYATTSEPSRKLSAVEQVRAAIGLDPAAF